MSTETIFIAILTFLLGALLSGGAVYYKMVQQIGQEITALKKDVDHIQGNALFQPETQGTILAICRRYQSIEDQIASNTARLNRIITEHETLMKNHNREGI